MNKSLIIAIAVLVGLSAAVVSMRRSHESETKVEKPAVTLPKVKKEDITSVEITRPNQPAIVLQKQPENKWRVKAPLDAEAEQNSIDAVIEKLADMEVTGVAAQRKENYKRLEVDPEHAIHVVAKQDAKVLTDLWIGAAKSGGTMVRAEGQEPVLSAKGSFRYIFERELKDFRDRDVTSVENKELTGVQVTSAKGTFKFERATGDDPWAQAKGEKPIPEFDSEKVTSFLNTAAHLYATDFAEPKEDEAATGLSTPQSTVTLTKKDGSTVVLKLGKQHAGGQDYYVNASTWPGVIFRISNFNAERLMPDAKFWAKEKTPPAQAGGAPSGQPVAGGGDLPPELMKQLEQLKMGHDGKLGPH